MEKNKEKNLFRNPTKVQFYSFIGLWITGLILSVLAMTDLFRETIFQRKNLMMILLHIFSIGVCIRFIRNIYLKNMKRLNEVYISVIDYSNPIFF